MIVVTHGQSPLDLRNNGLPSKQEEVTRVCNLQKVLMIHDINLQRGEVIAITYLPKLLTQSLQRIRKLEAPAGMPVGIENLGPPLK